MTFVLRYTSQNMPSLRSKGIKRLTYNPYRFMAPSHILIEQATSPSDDLVEKAIALIVELSIQDPAALAFCGNDASLIPLLLRTWVKDGVAVGELWTAMEGDALVGFLLLIPPDAGSKISTEDRAKIHQPLLDALPQDALRYYKAAYHNEFPEFVSQCISPLVLNDIWWLRSAMVRRDKQRQGIVRALLEPVRRKVADRGQSIACSTTTARNVPVYKALGFEQRGMKEMDTPWHKWPLYVFLLKP